MRPRTHFHITVGDEETLSVEEIWPEGDAPANPTTDDVIEQIRQSTNEHRFADDWGFGSHVDVDGTPVKW